SFPLPDIRYEKIREARVVDKPGSPERCRPPTPDNAAHAAVRADVDLHGAVSSPNRDGLNSGKDALPWRVYYPTGDKMRGISTDASKPSVNRNGHKKAQTTQKLFVPFLAILLSCIRDLTGSAKSSMKTRRRVFAP